MPRLSPLAAGTTFSINDRPSRIDGHAHVFHRGLPFAAGRRYAPAYDAPLELYLRKLDENGLSHGVLVQPSFLGTDNSYLVACLKAAAGRLGGIAVVADTASIGELEALSAAGVSGIRWNLIGRSLPDLDAPETATLIDRVKGLGWQIEIQRNAADLATIAEQLIDREITVVFDHWGLSDPKLGIEDPGFARLVALGRTGQAWMKISAPYRNGEHGRALCRAAYPRLADAFGLDRLIWGSDWPHTQYEPSETYERNRAFLDDLVPDEADRSRILTSSRELFRL